MEEKPVSPLSFMGQLVAAGNEPSQPTKPQRAERHASGRAETCVKEWIGPVALVLKQHPAGLSGPALARHFSISRGWMFKLLCVMRDRDVVKVVGRRVAAKWVLVLTPKKERKENGTTKESC